jgi:hypothetical protein
MELALGSNTNRIEHHLVMDKDQRVRYKCCPTDFEVDNMSTPDSQNSSIQSRSPRCEAFVMTGDKMLNLNPKISPSYAKMCHDQLPPAVHQEPEKIKTGSQFDHFPSMHKNNHGRIRSSTLCATEESNQIDVATKSESHLGNIKEKELLTEGQDNNSKILDNQHFSESSSANVIPADPSSIHSDNNFIENEFSKQTNLSFNDPLINSSAISRLIASNQSQSLPSSPAHIFSNKHLLLIIKMMFQILMKKPKSKCALLHYQCKVLLEHYLYYIQLIHKRRFHVLPGIFLLIKKGSKLLPFL